ncbi:hypothetical protein V1477_018668 [Vespula maculifrons]|uniref:Uncharacterized protein n=1 Tax=Vespula maculifrons TaxID=7453 RepID=A0ABD2AWX4_VESMC
MDLSERRIEKEEEEEEEEEEEAAAAAAAEEKVEERVERGLKIACGRAEYAETARAKVQKDELTSKDIPAVRDDIWLNIKILLPRIQKQNDSGLDRGKPVFLIDNNIFKQGEISGIVEVSLVLNGIFPIQSDPIRSDPIRSDLIQVLIYIPTQRDQPVVVPFQSRSKRMPVSLPSLTEYSKREGICLDNRYLCGYLNTRLSRSMVLTEFSRSRISETLRINKTNISLDKEMFLDIFVRLSSNDLLFYHKDRDQVGVANSRTALEIRNGRERVRRGGRRRRGAVLNASSFRSAYILLEERTSFFTPSFGRQLTTKDGRYLRARRQRRRRSYRATAVKARMEEFLWCSTLDLEPQSLDLSKKIVVKVLDLENSISWYTTESYFR